MFVFKEIQRLRQWWILLFQLTVLGLISYGLISQLIFDIPFGDKPISNLGLIIIAILIFLFIMTLFLIKLETIITSKGIQFGFKPFQRKGISYSWNEIHSIVVSNYNPLTDFGGWGWRISLKGKGQAYTISGNYGILIKLKNGKVRLVGTKKPNEVKRVLSQINLSD